MVFDFNMSNYSNFSILFGVISSLQDKKQLALRNNVVKHVVNFDIRFKDDIKLSCAVWDDDIKRTKDILQVYNVSSLTFIFYNIF